MRNICSVLAGYVWDKSNPYVTQAERALGIVTSCDRRLVFAEENHVGQDRERVEQGYDADLAEHWADNRRA